MISSKRSMRTDSQRQKPRHNLKGIAGTAAQTRESYDANSGQVYRETTVALSRRHNSDWIGEFKTPSLVTRTGANEHGSRTLFDIAVSRCIKGMKNFTPEHLEAVPWSIGERVWQEVIRRRSESFHTWRTFAAAYGLEFGSPANRYMLDIKSPPLAFEEYYRGINSINGHWLTALRISPKQIRIQDLMAVSTLSNLVALDLSDALFYVESRRSVFDERVLRSWAEMASTGHAFQKLTVLLLGWQENVTSSIFAHLNSFPALRCVILTDCQQLHQRNRKEWEAEIGRLGWSALHAKKSVKTLRPLLDDRDFYIGNISNCYYEALSPSTEELRSVEKRRKVRPLLECWLGTPQRWLHILDEFPGTRTIWFYKHDSLEGRGSSKNDSNSTAEASKRPREIITASPPSKRKQNGAAPKARTPRQTTTGLLGELGL